MIFAEFLQSRLWLLTEGIAFLSLQFAFYKLSFFFLKICVSQHGFKSSSWKKTFIINICIKTRESQNICVLCKKDVSCILHCNMRIYTYMATVNRKTDSNLDFDSSYLYFPFASKLKLQIHLHNWQRFILNILSL